MKKKLGINLLLATSLVIGSFVVTLPGQNNVVEAATVKVLYKGKVTASSLNVRSSASTKGKVLGKLKKNTTVEIVSSKSGWYGIKFKGKTGYVSSSYVSKVSTAPKVLYKGTITITSVNVYSQAKKASKKLGSLKKNNTVEVVGTSGSWTKFKYKSTYGYVWSQYVKKQTPPPKVQYKGTVTLTSVNVYSQAKKTSKKLGSLKKNNTVEVVGTSGSWTKIKYKTTYGYVWSQFIKKQSTPSVGTAPKAEKPYKLPLTGSTVLGIDVGKSSKVKLTNSFNQKTKDKELKELAKAVGANYYKSELAFIDYDNENPMTFNDKGSVIMEAYGDLILFGYECPRNLKMKESRFLLKQMIKPYLPTKYASLVDTFFDKGYYYGAQNTSKPLKYDGKEVEMTGGTIYIYQ